MWSEESSVAVSAVAELSEPYVTADMNIAGVMVRIAALSRYELFEGASEQDEWCQVFAAVIIFELCEIDDTCICYFEPLEPLDKGRL
ncbi:MAG: hypothetical protein IJ549_03245 [Prevotella sp.]|nr:hypothetical protein [Prevotella sp.]